MKLGLRLLHSERESLYCYRMLVVKVQTGNEAKNKTRKDQSVLIFLTTFLIMLSARFARLLP